MLWSCQSFKENWKCFVLLAPTERYFLNCLSAVLSCLLAVIRVCPVYTRIYLFPFFNGHFKILNCDENYFSRLASRRYWWVLAPGRSWYRHFSVNFAIFLRQLFCRTLPGENDWHGYPLDFIRNRHHRFSDYVWENKSSLIRFNSFKIRSKLCVRSLKQLTLA